MSAQVAAELRAAAEAIRRGAVGANDPNRLIAALKSAAEEAAAGRTADEIIAALEAAAAAEAQS